MCAYTSPLAGERSGERVGRAGVGMGFRGQRSDIRYQKYVIASVGARFIAPFLFSRGERGEKSPPFQRACPRSDFDRGGCLPKAGGGLLKKIYRIERIEHKEESSRGGAENNCCHSARREAASQNPENRARSIAPLALSPTPLPLAGEGIVPSQHCAFA